LLLLMLMAIGTGGLRESFLGSDDLYLPTLFEDLTRWSGQIGDWRLTPAPYFFPDMLLYAVMRFVTGSIEWAQYLSGVVHLGLFVLAGSALASTAAGASSRFGWFFAPITVVLFLVHRSGQLPLFGALFHLTHHGGSTLVAIVVLRMVSATDPNPRWVTVSLALVCAVTGLSDPLFAASFGAPLLAMSGIAAVRTAWRYLAETSDDLRRLGRDRMFSCAAGSFAGALLTKLMHEHMNGLPVASSKKGTFELIASVVGDLTGPALGEGIWLAIGVVLAVWTLGADRGPAAAAMRQLAVFVIGSTSITIVAIGVDGGYLDTGSIRYFMLPYWVSFVFVYALATREFSRRVDDRVRRRVLLLAASASVVAVVSIVVAGIPMFARAQFRSDWRGTAECIEGIARRENVDAVIAEYWFAKPIMLFSNRRVMALQMRAKLRRPYLWINSRGWYRSPKSFGVVVLNELRPDSINQTYGGPFSVEHCGRLEVGVYRDAARARLTAGMNKQIARFLADPYPP
jgi:hypothetical protein